MLEFSYGVTILDVRQVHDGLCLSLCLETGVEEGEGQVGMIGRTERMCDPTRLVVETCTLH